MATMASAREERLAANEAMFRHANERMSVWEEQRINENVELYACECADLDCHQKLGLTKAEYESVRANSRHFLVARGHEIPDVETVIEEHGDWVVIEKDAEVTETVEKLDPRH
jgi:hypothetical protein